MEDFIVVFYHPARQGKYSAKKNVKPLGGNKQHNPYTSTLDPWIYGLLRHSSYSTRINYLARELPPPNLHFLKRQTKKPRNQKKKKHKNKPEKSKPHPANFHLADAIISLLYHVSAPVELIIKTNDPPSQRSTYWPDAILHGKTRKSSMLRYHLTVPSHPIPSSTIQFS